MLEIGGGNLLGLVHQHGAGEADQPFGLGSAFGAGDL